MRKYSQCLNTLENKEVPWEGKNSKVNTKLTLPMALPSESTILVEECLYGAGSAAQLLTKSLRQVGICSHCEPDMRCKSILKYEAK